MEAAFWRIFSILRRNLADFLQFAKIFDFLNNGIFAVYWLLDANSMARLKISANWGF